MNCPDGLCGGVLAYKLATPAPLLLVNPGTGESAAAVYVAENDIEKRIIFGGTAGITDESAANIFG